MSYSNTYTVVSSTILLRSGIKHIIFTDDNYTIAYYGCGKCKVFPLSSELSDEQLDELVKELNATQVNCIDDSDIISEDNC